MALSKKIPSSYTTRWSAFAQWPTHEVARAADNPPTTQTLDGTKRKYNSSCNSCRKSRVKCSGGSPCQRCAASSDLTDCVYSLSQRRGKRKANEALSPETPLTQPTSAWNDFGFNDMEHQHDWLSQHDPLWLSAQNAATKDHGPGLDENFSQSNVFHLANVANETPSLIDFMASSPIPELPGLFRKKRHGDCVLQCYSTIHDTMNKMAILTDDPGYSGFDKILELFDASVAQAATYITCSHCDAGCDQMTTLAMLHQRQVKLLCDIAKSPHGHLQSDTTLVTVGTYQPSKNDDLMLKKMMLLGVTHRVQTNVENFCGLVEKSEECHKSGTKLLSEAGQVNIKWLHDVGETLKKHLLSIQNMLHKETWEPAPYSS